MNSLLAGLALAWLLLASFALVSLAYALSPPLILVVGWFGGIVSAAIAYQVYKLYNPDRDDVVVNVNLPV